MSTWAKVWGGRLQDLRLSVFGALTPGAVPAASASPSSSKFLAEDGQWRTSAGGAVDSVNGQTGTVVLDAADVGADATGTASSAVSGHVAASDPHGDRAAASSALAGHVAASDPHGDRAYAAGLVDDLSGVTNASAARTALGLGGAAVLSVGTSAGTVAAGDDSRLSNSRAPTGSAGGDLTGTYPSPTVAAQAIGYAKTTFTATQKLLGRTSSGSGAGEEVGVSAILDWLSSTQGAVLYRGASSWAALAAGTAGKVLRTQGSGANPAWSDTLNVFGNGRDGSLDFDGVSTITLADGTTIVPSGGAYTLPQDILPTDMRVRSSVVVECRDYEIIGNGTLTLDDATAVIRRKGANASGATAGAALGSVGSLGCVGQAGATGVTTNAAGNVTAGLTRSIGARGGNGGAGVNGGGTAGTVTAPTAAEGSVYDIGFYLGRRWRTLSGTTWNNVTGGSGGGSGGAKPNTGTATSGGGGAGSGILQVRFRYIVGAGLITAPGGNGGNAAVTGDGVAGGGGGGGGGRVVVMSSTPTLPCTLSAPGGSGGTGAGGGSAGSSGSAGTTEQVVI